VEPTFNVSGNVTSVDMKLSGIKISFASLSSLDLLLITTECFCVRKVPHSPFIFPTVFSVEFGFLVTYECATRAARRLSANIFKLVQIYDE
jgi:hypothetical protein